MTAPKVDALIAFGGNVGDVRDTFNRAVVQFCDGTDVQLTARSSDYVTPPWGVRNQPPFINLCLAVETSLMPHDLLAHAQNVEQMFGRDRTSEQHWGPRTLDIDILTYDDLVMRTPELTLPHPRLFERAFVLVPLAEIAPERMILGWRVRAVLAKLDTAGIEKLPRR
jgi:2-amino-4-hydroxy-6-hydroxymethyldihydropteridine diphosphokinase